MTPIEAYVQWRRGLEALQYTCNSILMVDQGLEAWSQPSSMPGGSMAKEMVGTVKRCVQNRKDLGLNDRWVGH